MDEYSLVYSARKTLGLEVTREGKVVVRAPFGCQKAIIAQFVTSHTEWISRAKARVRQKERPPLSADEIAMLKEKAREVLPTLVEKYSELTGLVPAGVRVTSAKTRFGSCSAQNRICFSFRLMQYPLPAVEYVVLHELAHIRHHNHKAGFYRLIVRYMPDYKEREKLLRQ